MFCRVAQRSFPEFSAVMQDAAIARRIPYMGTLELTHRCNLSCCHCYCNRGLNDRRKADELTTAEIKRILDEAADAGCLWLLLTGGEVLVREDFLEIYLYAIKKGMLVEVFTNATLIDDRVAAAFAEFPPFGLDISIYGSNPALHDAITRTKGSFERMLRGMEVLRRHKVGFTLKTIIMTLNRDDMKPMQRFVEGLGVRFHYDTLISPRTDGGMSPAQYRLSAEEMADIDLEQDYEVCEKIFGAFWNKRPEEPAMCGAGIFAFNIDPYGVLSPCTMFRSFQYPLKGEPFDGAWKRLTDEYESKKREFIPAECRSCSMLLLCGNCPAWAEIESRGWTRKVDYVCEYVRCLEKKFFKKKEAGYAKKTV